jgi:DNA uptake protein ComE-like DNA-binding protein/anti-anti-sigma regulatory factor
VAEQGNFVLSERALDARCEVLAIEGDASALVAPRLRARLQDLIKHEQPLTIVDMSRVSFVDSTIVQTLVAAGGEARKAGSRLLVVEPVDPIKARPLEIGRLDLSAEVAPTLAAAARLAEVPEEKLKATALPPPLVMPSKPRRKMFGRRRQDQHILQELAQLRRFAQEARRNAAAAKPEAEPEAEDAHRRIEDLERELTTTRALLAAVRAELESARASSGRMEVQAAERSEPTEEPLPEEERSAHVEAAAERLEAEVTEPPAPPAGPRPRVPVWADPAPINLNTAEIEDLMLLPGIGRRPAERILATRSERGGFGSIEELYEIPEVRDRINRIRPHITV